ncbi:hypothetical protein [Microbulbifer sp. SAOS-129_SWC]|uniref:hypothetical protein n=1 Tax=Microbulbifer sp. SAOS-129_SWC TaxID=3145235 RepID=UPI0032176853
MAIIESPAGQQLRALAANLDGLADNLPAMVRMVLPDIDTEGAAQVLNAAADELDRLAALDRWAEGSQVLLEELQDRVNSLEGRAD